MNLFWQFICMITFGAACWAAGDILLRSFLGKQAVLPGSARPALAFATGNVLISYFLTALGFIGGYVPSVLWAVFFGGIGITIWCIVRELKRYLDSRSGDRKVRDETDKRIARERRKENHARIFLAVILGLFLLSTILQAAAPPYVRDSLVYHLLCPKEYLKATRLVHIKGNLFSAFPKGHEVLMTVLLGLGGDRAAQGFSILQQVAAIGALYSLIRIMVGPWSSAVCTLGYATVPPVIYVTGCGYVEPALLMTLGGSASVLFFFLRSREQKSIAGSTGFRTIALVGFLAGWMPALKYNGLIYLGLIGLILVWSYKRAPSREGLAVIGIFSLSAGPGLCWMAWNWITLGNPVYPMAWGLFGGRNWDESRALAMSLYLDTYGMGKSLWDYLMLPWRLAFSGRFDTVRFDGAIGPFLIILLILTVTSAILLIRRKSAPVMMKETGVMFVLSAAFFVFGTQQVRFWLPSQLLGCAFVAPVAGLVADFARNRRILKMVLFLTIAASLAWNMAFLSKQFITAGYYKPVLGMEGERAFLIRKVPGYPALEFINRNLPENSYTLCVWTGAYGYYLNRNYYSDTFIEDFTLKELIHASANGKELSQRLMQAGFTHLFLSLSILEKNMEQDERITFHEFLTKESRQLFRYQNYGVFEIYQ
jgi:hypothetical protein